METVYTKTNTHLFCVKKCVTVCCQTRKQQSHIAYYVHAFAICHICASLRELNVLLKFKTQYFIIGLLGCTGSIVFCPDMFAACLSCQLGVYTHSTLHMCNTTHCTLKQHMWLIHVYVTHWPLRL